MGLNQEVLQAIEQLKKGEQEGFNTLYSNTYNYVYSRAKYSINDEQEVFDLMQEVYVSVYKNISSLKDADSLYAWLGSITVRQGAKMANKRKHQVLVSEENESMFEQVPDEELIEEQLANEQDAEAIKECIAGLSEEQRIAVMAYYYDGLKVEEIAELSGVSVGTIKSRLYAARKYLKESITELEKKQGYKLHSFGAPTLMLAIKLLLDGSQMSGEKAQAIYNSVCAQVGIQAGELTLGGAAASQSVKTVGIISKVVGLGKVKMISIIGAIAIGGCAIGGIAYSAINDRGNETPVVSETEADKKVKEEPVKETKTVDKKEVTVDYLQYVKGLRDWIVVKGVKTDFMTDVTFDKKYIEAVEVDDKNVKIDVPGEYKIVYTIIPKIDSKDKKASTTKVSTKDSSEDLKITKTVSVKVLEKSEVEKLVKEGKEVVTEEGIKNKQERKASSISDKDTVVKETVTTNNSSGSSSKPDSNPKPDPKPDSKPSENSNNNNSNNSSKPDNGNQEKPKPSHTHTWVDDYETVTVPAVTETITHPEESHVETVVIQEAYEKPSYAYGYVCNYCGFMTTDINAMYAEQKAHALNDEPSGFSNTNSVPNGTETVPAVTEQRKVVDTPQWTETKVITPETTKQVKVGSHCSGCGATK